MLSLLPHVHKSIPIYSIVTITFDPNKVHPVIMGIFDAMFDQNTPNIVFLCS